MPSLSPLAKSIEKRVLVDKYELDKSFDSLLLHCLIVSGSFAKVVGVYDHMQ